MTWPTAASTISWSSAVARSRRSTSPGVNTQKADSSQYGRVGGVDGEAHLLHPALPVLARLPLPAFHRGRSAVAADDVEPAWAAPVAPKPPRFTELEVAAPGGVAPPVPERT